MGSTTKLAILLLGILLIISSVVGVVFMLTSTKSEHWNCKSDTRHAMFPCFKLTLPPAFVYYVATLSVGGVYGRVTILTSCCVIFSPEILVLFVILDVLILGMIASVTGTAGSVLYILLKYDDKFVWPGFCSAYTCCCRHLAFTFGLSLFASILLTFLLCTTIFTLYRRIAKPRPSQLTLTNLF